ncbi:plasmid recombination protein [Chryseobacterium sp. NKUCC03_KSP]|uniref:plasmid recombination protein n=1 Tax=Chryseobacterium sp. NKUCC03_KSP TaxID=2842125 RepID=UPI001C5BBEBE|nr:plasmid recombination protein [Chryseobacterium sp. NKUCC03_KSP]MBW3521846.1 plasmid recombination protein [Chryseobacterium sp. NKUCC03_KSP]
MKTSINFKVVKSDSETHNFRKKTFDYIRKDLTPKNEYWMEQKIVDRIQKIEAYCKEKSGRKLQKNAMPVREAVVVIKENTTMLELQNLAKRLEEELSIRVFQIAVHKDEGHTDKDTKEWKPNYHAHLVADWQDLKTEKTLKHQSFHYSKMQDLTAECLNMERGISGSRGRLEAIEFKIQQKEEDLKVLEERYDLMKSEMGSKKSEELVVKENVFLGFKKIKTDKTIENYEKAFRTYKSTILKNKTELGSKSKQITELNTKVIELQKQVHLFKNKNAVLLSNPTVFASEKKKYLDSVINIVEREIKFSRFRNPHLDRIDKQKLISEMEKIAQKISQENTVPFSAFNEIFKDTEITNQLFSLLQFGNNSTNYEAEDIPIQNKRKRKRL